MQIQNPEIPIEIRMDIHFDENILAQQLSVGRGIIVTNKRISKTLLQQFRPNIPALVYVITEEDEPQFIQDIRDLGINIVLLTHLPPEIAIPKRINYYEVGKINQYKYEPKEVVDTLKKDIENLYFKSNKLVADGGKLYMSNVSRLAGDEYTDDFTFYKAVDSPEFWQELQFMTLVKKV